MPSDNPEVFLLYQMGSADEWTWYSVVGVFLSEEALRRYTERNAIALGSKLMETDGKSEIVLPEPLEFVAVRTVEGSVPDVELEDQV